MPHHEAIDVFTYMQIPVDGNTEVCWPWLGKVNPTDGRPYITVKGVKWLAYRLSWSLVFGEVPEGLVLRHSCDNKTCCNPHHLIPGTQSENENDKYDRDRYGFPLKVIEGILFYSTMGLSQEQIADVCTHQYGVIVTQQRVSDIVNGQRRARQTGAKNG